MDLNGDGHNDLLSGSYSRMQNEMAGLFQVLWGQPKNQFKKAQVLNGTDGKPLIIPIKNKSQQTENICTRPTAIDWDGDGDLDLIVGNFSGTFYLFRGEGKGKFQPKPELVKAGDKPLRISGAHSDPFMIDWDGDGDLDLLSGSSNGGVYWAENHAKNAKQEPVLREFKTLIEPGRPVAYGSPLSEDELKGPTTSTRIWVDDVNGDGKLDVLVGDSVTLVSPAAGLSKEEYKKRLAKWNEESSAATAKLRDTKASQKERQEAIARYNKLYQERRKIVKDDRTGFVWLYLQK